MATNAINIVSNPSKLINLIEDLLFNPNKIALVALLLIPIELILNIMIVFKIPCNKYDLKSKSNF